MTLATWGALTAAASLSNGMAAWFRPAHFVIAMIAGLFVLMVAVIAVMGVMFAGGETSVAGFDPRLTVALGLFGLLLLAPLGGALYGRGLERFELVRK